MRTLHDSPLAEDKVQAVKHGLLALFCHSGIHISHLTRTELLIVPILLLQICVLLVTLLHLTSKRSVISTSAQVSTPLSLG